MSAARIGRSPRSEAARWLELALALAVGLGAAGTSLAGGSVVVGLLALLLAFGWAARLVADWPALEPEPEPSPEADPTLVLAIPEGARLPPRALESSALLTKSGVFQLNESASDPGFDPMISGGFGDQEMVNRLDPVHLRWLDSSPGEQRFLGWPLGTLRGMSFLEIVRPDQRELAREQIRSAIERGEALGLVFGIRTAAGQPRAIELNVGARYDATGAASQLRCHLTDVTERLRADRVLRRRTRQLTHANERLRLANVELRELERRYSDLYQNAPVMYYSLDREGRFLDLNDTMVRALGFEREALIGRPYPTILPDSCRGRFAERFARYLETGHIEVESRWRKASGEHIDVWITATAHRDADGRPSHSRSVATDVTAKKALESRLRETNADLARLNDELVRKNVELDEFGRIVSHDLRQPVRTVIRFAELLLAEHADRLDAEAQDFLRYMAGASKRMRALIESLLSHGRAGRVLGELQPVRLSEVVEAARSDLAGLLAARGASILVSGELPEVAGDRERLVQLFANLLSNGLKYNRSERPRVEVGATLDHADGRVVVAVRDNGIGIDPVHHGEIFQIFRRLHAEDEYEGTGAGLAICRKIVEAHGGRIDVESREGEGATFLVRLPAPARAAKTAAHEQVRNEKDHGCP